MASALTAPRPELSDFAPRLITIKIHPDKIREVIGKGGSVIQAITKETGTQIDIQDDGTITVASVDAAAGKAAKDRIEQITSDVEPGRIYEGKVVKLMDFGAFVTISPGKDGLVHVSQISNERVEKVSDKLKEGDIVKVKVLEVDKQGRIRLSMKAVEEGEGAAAEYAVATSSCATEKRTSARFFWFFSYPRGREAKAASRAPVGRRVLSDRRRFS